MSKQYKLTDVNGNIYLSDTPGEYQKHRVFFADEKTALAAGFRPCGSCLRAKYKEYMADPKGYKKKFGL